MVGWGGDACEDCSLTVARTVQWILVAFESSMLCTQI